MRVLHYCRGMGKGGEKDDCPPRAAFKGSPKKRWVVDGVSYDLTPFLAKHPGGPDFLLWSANRDISIAVHTYHKDPERTVLPLLRRYRCEEPPVKSVKRLMGVPQFLLPPKFDAVTDTPSYDWGPGTFLADLVKEMARPAVARAVKAADAAFDRHALILLFMYGVVVSAWLSCVVRPSVAAIALILLRTALAGAGHSFVHRPKSPWGALFDFNYVGHCTTAVDGHALLHHGYTQTEADVKRGFFGGMMGVARAYRVPIHTLHKLGHVVTGCLVRQVDLQLERDAEEHQGVEDLKRALGLGNWAHVGFWAVHVCLRVELYVAWRQGLRWSWLFQFIGSLWLNTLLVVSSHDFDDLGDESERDWAVFQLAETHDMSITGWPRLDCWLSAGLAPHRAHHLLPYQRSAYANIASEPAIRRVCERRGIAWDPPKGLGSEILPVVFRRLFAPACDPATREALYADAVAEHASWRQLAYCVSYVGAGVCGIGSI